MSENCIAQPPHLTDFEDEIAALTLQLDELGLYTHHRKGKHPIDHPPDCDAVYASFQAEIEQYRTYVADQQLAHSMGAAVDSDGPVLADLAAKEIQCHEDRLFALRICNTDPDSERPPLSATKACNNQALDWVLAVTEVNYAGSIIEYSDNDGSEAEAGPSGPYTAGQEEALTKLLLRQTCVVCREDVFRHSPSPCHARIDTVSTALELSSFVPPRMRPYFQSDATRNRFHSNSSHGT